MSRVARYLCLFFLVGCFVREHASAENDVVKKILVVVEGNTDLKNYAMGDGRQLATLFGHFSVAATVKGVNAYSAGELQGYDYTFYIGFHAKNNVPFRFLDDVFKTDKPVIWMNTGFAEFSQRYNVKKRFGFSVSNLDSLSQFDVVKSGAKVFSKGEPNTNLIQIANRSSVKIVASAYSSKKKKETPYIVQSQNLMYIADSPFASASEGDRYLLFADMLHDILNEQHEQSHRAIIRIEDVDVMENPDHLREVADILSSRGIPFLVGVIPYYVDPGSGIRLSLSDKPNVVDALQYMVKNGGTVTMHGVTHQYKGTTGVDFEFWDESTNRPIKEETPDAIARKLETGIQEFMKNGLYPLVWETPHYTASFNLYKTVSKYFSTACEQRLSIEDADYSQYFPYIIKKDLFGQTIYPENLGYVPLNPNKEESEQYIQNILRNAKTQLYVRDGVTGVFFHPFLDLNLLKQLADGLQNLGYSFLDLREQTNWVKTNDRTILSGSQSYTINLNDQYLLEAYYDESGEIKDRSISEKRYKGPVTKNIALEPREFYKAEPTEFRDRPVSFVDNVVNKVERTYNTIFSTEENWNPLRVAVLWNYFAKGAAYNDQSAFASVFKSINVKVDTIFLGQPLKLSNYNLVVVPFAFVDSLQETDFDRITEFVDAGGNIITDMKSDLSEELGMTFIDTRIRVIKIRDRFFPEERITWRYGQLVNKFEANNIDEIFCADEATDAPMIIGKRYGKGKVIYLNSLFDPYSHQGYSLYPYLLEYVRKYFRLKPMIRRDNLEVYFDPGFRHSYSIEQLVAQWVRQGIRIVHTAGWHQYPKYTFDYARLIRLAHANGILVYAWIEPPQVNQMFWTKHPEWREKNYKGEDVLPSWRYPVAMTDTGCVKAMVQEYDTLLKSYDWDGVNLAEVYFEAGRGFEDAKFYTPMHPSARNEIKRKFGFDPVALFDPTSPYYWRINADAKAAITNFRIHKLDDVYRQFLTLVENYVKSKSGFQVVVTVMDSYGSPELTENIGVDMRHILALQKQYGFVLQVEDPETRWSSHPSRYIGMGKRYSELIGDSTKLMLDLNILSFRKKDAITEFPTLIQTGTESFDLIRSASIGAERFTVYSEASVNPQDMSFFANAMASGVQYSYIENGYRTNSRYPFSIKLPAEYREIMIDGKPVPSFRDNVFVIPTGEHTVLLSQESVGSFSTHQLQTRIMSITGNLLSLVYGLRDVSFEYESDKRTLISLSNLPTAVEIDGAPYQFTVMKGNDCYTIFLPVGRHRVTLTAGDQFSYGVNVTSLWSTTAIAFFGALAVAMLFVMYFSLKFIKRR